VVYGLYCCVVGMLCVEVLVVVLLWGSVYVCTVVCQWWWGENVCITIAETRITCASLLMRFLLLCAVPYDSGSW
jgi:hypothetical protein